MDFDHHSLVYAAAPERVIVPRLAVAATPLSRAVGLLGRAGLPPGTGLLITPCDAIHMFFMRFAIDAVFLDGEMRVVGVRPGLRPWRLACCRGARAVLELPAGAAAGLVPGDLVALAGPAPAT